MADAPAGTARAVKTIPDVHELIDAILDPARTLPIIAVTTKPSEDAPFLDVDALAARIGEKAHVWVLTEADITWELTDALPAKIDVYGGAARAWNPITEGDQEPYPSDHPQWTMFNTEEGAKVSDLIVEYIELTSGRPLPAFGDRTTATVTRVFRAGAELEISTGHPGFVSMGHLIQHGEVFHTADVLVKGQEVPVRIGAWNAQAGRLSVSLREFAPDPWERLAEVYQEGDLIEGGVTGVTQFGAFVELLPGVEGLLHKSKIADEFVEYVDDYVQEGDRVIVRLLDLDVRNRKAGVGMRDVPRNATAAPVASIFPDGPPWLPDPNAPAPAESSDDEQPGDDSYDAGRDDYDEPRSDERPAREDRPARDEHPADDDEELPPHPEDEAVRRDAQARAAALPRVSKTVEAADPEASYTPELLALVGLIADHGVEGSALESVLRSALERGIATFDGELDDADDATDESPESSLATVRDAARDLIEALRAAAPADEDDAPAAADESTESATSTAEASAESAADGAETGAAEDSPAEPTADATTAEAPDPAPADESTTPTADADATSAADAPDPAPSDESAATADESAPADESSATDESAPPTGDSAATVEPVPADEPAAAPADGISDAEVTAELTAELDASKDAPEPDAAPEPATAPADEAQLALGDLAPIDPDPTDESA